MERWLVTGGAGFIGSNFILAARRGKRAEILNLDRLTYAGNPVNLDDLKADSAYRLLEGDIADRDLVRKALCDFSPTAVFHFAAESHVDRSIASAAEFVRTNVEGTARLLASAGNAGARTSVHISAAGIIMDEAGTPVRDADARVPTFPNHFSAYLASKVRAESIVLAANRPDFRTLAVRPSALWGGRRPVQSGASPGNRLRAVRLHQPWRLCL